MPLLDHFRPPIFNKGSWEGFHGGWPMTMVMDLCKSLPEQYTAEPRVHLGKNFEVDVCTFDVEGKTGFGSSSFGSAPATATWAPPEPTLTLELDPTEIYEYEVLIFDQQRGRELVAAIELVSPANKDRPETRQAFVSQCAIAEEDLRFDRRSGDGEAFQPLLRSAGSLLSDRSRVRSGPAIDLRGHVSQSQSGNAFAIRVVGLSNGSRPAIACPADLAGQRPRHFAGSRSLLSTDVQCAAIDLMLSL